MGRRLRSRKTQLLMLLIFRDGPNPYGIAPLDSSLVSQQPYDIIVSLNVPRSPPNLAQGNFMLSLSLLPPTYKPALQVSSTSILKSANTVSQEEVLFFSRRPAILTYTSRLVSLSERLLALPLYILRLRQESEILHIPMAESQSFPKGWKNVPGYVMLELQAGQEVQVYDVRVLFTARFGGLRWLMYNHRIISFLIFTSSFWFSEVLFTILGWLAVRAIFSPKQEVKKELVKAEDTDGSVKVEGAEETDEPDLSDTPRTFPTYGRQAPLRYVPKVKEEDSGEFIMDETTIQPLAAEADDEDEEELEAYKGGRDSGIGTSFSEGGERSGIARRRSRGGK
jgi:seipin